MTDLALSELQQMPKVKSKPKKKTDLRKLLEQFDTEKMRIAQIEVTKEHTAKGLRIGIGRILSKDKRTDIETFESADSKAVILKRK